MIDETVVIGILRGAIAAIEQLATKPSTQPATPPATSVVNGMRIDDRDLDGPYGNPVIKAADPRDWIGPSMRGKTLSECTPEYLFMLASRYDYFAEKAERDGAETTSGKPKAPFDRREALRCRGWAQRLLNGWQPPAPVTADEIPWQASGPMPTDDDIPF